jgi:hypothetical protein
MMDIIKGIRCARAPKRYRESALKSLRWPLVKIIAGVGTSGFRFWAGARN